MMCVTDKIVPENNTKYFIKILLIEDFDLTRVS